MNVFKLHPKAGIHVETLEDGSVKTYKAGSTITTDKELDKMFPGKFLRLSDPTSTEFGVDQPEIPIPSKFVSFNVPDPEPESDPDEDTIDSEIPIPSKFLIEKVTRETKAKQDDKKKK